MRILHIITSLCSRGAERFMVELLPQLRRSGDEVELLVFDGTITPFYKELISYGITIHHLSRGGSVYNPLNIFKLVKYMVQFDIIHTHLTACQFYTPLAHALSLSHKPLVTTEHSANNRRRGKWWFKPLDRWMYNRYRAIICIGSKTRLNLEAHIGRRDNMLTIFNGVNVIRYENPIKDITGQQEFTISMIASFSEAKDQDTLLHALGELPENYRLQLVGDGPRRAALEKIISELHLQDRVQLMGIRTDIPDILAGSDIVVLSSHWEGLSLACIEGMASGRPFIASDVDGLREIVRKHGVLFTHGDAHQLAHHINDLCTNPDRYKEVAQNCQSRAREFDIRNTAQNYLQLYHSILGY